MVDARFKHRTGAGSIIKKDRSNFAATPSFLPNIRSNKKLFWYLSDFFSVLTFYTRPKGQPGSAGPICFFKSACHTQEEEEDLWTNVQHQQE